jgi:O-antigen/teichoic acid export membrane protein
MSLIKSATTGTQWTSALFILNLAQNILIVPFLISSLGIKEYSSWIVIFTFISILRTLDLGHQLFISNEFSRFKNNNFILARTILGSSLFIALILGLVELLIYLFIYFFDLTKEILGVNISFEVNLGIISMLIMWLLFGSIGGILTKISTHLGLFDFTIKWSIIQKILELFAIIIGFYFFSEISITLGLLSILYTLYSILLFLKLKNKLKSIYPWWKYINTKLGFINLVKSFSITLNSISDTLVTNGSVLAISTYCGLSTAGIFTTSRTFSNIILQVTQIPLQPIIPKTVQYYTENKYNLITKIYQIYFFLINVLIVITLIFSNKIENVFRFWIKDINFFNETILLSLVIISIINASGKIFTLIITSINRLEEINYITSVKILFTLPSIFIVLKLFIDIELFISTYIFIELLSSFVIPAFIFNRIFKFNIGDSFLFPLLSIFVLYIDLFYTQRIVDNNIFLLSKIISVLIITFLSYLYWSKTKIEIENILHKMINRK